MPFVQALRRYAACGALAFHTPGHKQGRGADSALRAFLTPEGLAADVSLMDELDDLGAPQTFLKQAQEAAARLYGADGTQFFVNGTTGAIHAMLLAALRPGETVIVPRNAHRSVLGGLILSGAQPYYVLPHYDAALGVALPVSPAAVEAALRACPEAKAVLAVHPTYYGLTAQLRQIARLAHARGALLLADEAHGAHLKFSARLPVQALDAGADMAAQSTHKLLGSLTQTSMLHWRGPRASTAAIQSASALVQSTSPNQLLLASLDAARAQMARVGVALVGRAVRLARMVRREINAIEGLDCFGEAALARHGAYALDVTKLTVSVRSLGLSGAQAESFLRQRYGIRAELADPDNVLFLLSYADGPRQAEALVAALADMAARFGVAPAGRVREIVPPGLPQIALPPRAAFFAAAETVDFATAAGRVCAETVMFYPPGIPVLCPGEVVGAAQIEYCRAMQAAGCKVVGPSDVSLKKIGVVKKIAG